MAAELELRDNVVWAIIRGICRGLDAGANEILRELEPVAVLANFQPNAPELVRFAKS